MSTDYNYPDQEKRNSIGRDVTFQLDALVDMLGREMVQDHSHVQDLLNATLPRLDALNNAAMSLFGDQNAFSGGALMKTVYGKDAEVEQAQSCCTPYTAIESRIDGAGLMLQAHGLLTVLLRHNGDEVELAQRRGAEDVLRTIGVAARALDECIAIPPSSPAASCKEAVDLAQDALTVLRMLEVSSFTKANESISGKVEQAHSDDVLTNTLSIAADMLESATDL